jgi:DNA-directed RNA polymerase subunit M/transcription elongation factor TFIIS
MVDEKKGNRALLRIFADAAEAGPALEFLRSGGLSCEIEPAPEGDGEGALPGVARGTWLRVSSDERSRAEVLLSSEEARIAGAENRRPACPDCGSTLFAAVAPSEAPAGSWWLRCSNCGGTQPVGEDNYLRDEFPILPASCPLCGSFLLEHCDPPPFTMDLPEDRPWCRCEACGHQWAGALEEKKAGKVESLAAPRLPSAPPPEPADFESDPDEVEEPEPEDSHEDAEENPNESESRWTCPRCGSRKLFLNDSGRAKDGLVRFLCSLCNEVWDEAVPEGEPLPDLPRLDEGDAADEARERCPNCGEGEGLPIDPPAWAGESRLSLLLKGFFKGKSWFRCPRCSHEWEG